ncbi:hypothetical protein EB796_019991 [Bugula neritina]|uniref:Uncharacterized protein n=1 Tax=Bugula neritina TaxID=10212 RepID=A0A7J7J6Q3_BUGNE|nr:hypothetical protein EB796_019991 [Bugula neritina]
MSQNSSAKKPKLSTDKPSENGHSAVHQNGNSHHPSTKIVCPEMAFYCFETLLNYFNKHYEAASSSSPLLSFADGR